MDDKDLIAIIRTNYTDARQSLTHLKSSQSCAGTIRAALESAVKLFWLKKYGKIPVWVKNDREEFGLSEALNDSRFSACFDVAQLSDMHVIRKMCNSVLHGAGTLTFEQANDLMNRLKSSITAISALLKLEILSAPTPAEKTPDARDPEDPLAALVQQLPDQPVKHWVFGIGRIVAAEKGSLKVDFGTTRKEFRFPEIFIKNFLSLQNPTLQRTLTQLLSDGQNGTDDSGKPDKPNGSNKSDASNGPDKPGPTIPPSPVVSPPAPPIFTSPKGNSFPRTITKSQALRLCREQGIEVKGKACTFASRNSSSALYWANPNVFLLNLPWILILNDNIRYRLYIFEIPANSLSPQALKTRKDKDSLIDLQIYYGDPCFTDSRSGVSFAPWLKKSISY